MMSGDHGLRVTLPASLQLLQDHPNTFLHLVGETDSLTEALADSAEYDAARISLVHADRAVEPGIKPSQVIRNSDGTSMQVALDLVAGDRAAAVVSAGDTGVLMGLGIRTLGMLPGFSRPACCSALPGLEVRGAYMLDLGATVDCSPALLHQFALMGVALVSSLEQVSEPRVALLSNGSEAGKGNEAIRAAQQLLNADARINACDLIEGNEIYSGKADVIVCDGLLGNVALKVAEGTAGLLGESLRAEQHGGAFLLGLRQVVVKSHGGASEAGFAAALRQAAECVQQQMVPRLAHYFYDQENDKHGV